MRKVLTLVEIMIVIAIIALLAAIAIPKLLIAVNESSAIANLRSLSEVCERYRADQTVPQYPPNLAALTGARPPYISGFTDGKKAGYTFTLIGAENTYQAIAVPITPGITGNHRFCVDHTSVLRASDTDIAVAVAGCPTGLSIVE